MNDEVRHLTERRAELEELELVAMLEQDPIDAELAALRERAAPLEEQAAELRRLVAEGQVEIDAALGEAISARAAEAALLPTALSDRYETCGPASRARGRRAWWAATATAAIWSCPRWRSRRSAPCPRARWPPASSAAASSSLPDRVDPGASR